MKIFAIRDEAADVQKDLAYLLYYELENDAWCCVRPSGTEPKIKLYMGVKADNMTKAECELEELKEAMKGLVK